jgi:hypothetical protein
MQHSQRKFSARYLWAPGALGHPPVDTFRQHRQLRGRQRDHAILSLRPDELSTVKTFGIKNKPLTIPLKDFQQVATPPAKAEKLAPERVLAELLLDQCSQPVKALAHVGHASRQPDPHTRW